MDVEWEYLVLKNSRSGWFADGMQQQERELITAMNVLGRDGWEAVAMIGHLRSADTADTTSEPATVYFKRPKTSRSGVVL